MVSFLSVAIINVLKQTNASAVYLLFLKVLKHSLYKLHKILLISSPKFGHNGKHYGNIFPSPLYLIIYNRNFPDINSK
jgi:hypothetical protein